MDLEVIKLLTTAILSPEGMAVTLVGLFVTQRIVPYWIHDQALAKLKQYEESTPVLLHELKELKRWIEHEKDDI